MPASKLDLNSEPPSQTSYRDCVRTYDRIAPLYDLLDAAYEHAWKRRLRAELFAQTRGRVLDVGVGTGCNIPYYPVGSEVVGIDSSRRMLARAGQRAQSCNRRVQLFEMNLLDLAFPDHSFDAVAATFVLICLPQELQLPALRELRRVCEPNGSILILDYKLSTRRAMRAYMRALSPWLRWAYAARYDAGTEDYVEDAGLVAITRRSYLHDAVTLLILKPYSLQSAGTAA